ncbi:uncharacterized protein [Hemitrygon akajei]|uniref:uncharacterized protein n=1 Tax=Hemitrygon akajei TaxID=2704970 RepID=UPI003BF94257
MFSSQQRGKIKNDKILRWRIELSTYTYDILYRPGRLNEPSDALSRGPCASAQLDQLYALHAQLCHPGVTRFYHFIKARNLPYSLEDIRTMTRDCQICAECKPHFYRPDTAQLVKATRPFERLSIDFKGPLPSTDRNVYFLSIIDEYSRFPFAVPCPDTTTTSVIKVLRQLFTLFGYPCYVHSDRGSSFMSDELRRFLLARGIATSRTTSYNPRGNGQVERENATVWKAILLALKSQGLPVSRWQEVLPEALHSIRSLLCTSTNATPHERLFSFPRKSVTGTTLPIWLTSPGPVLLRKHARSNKYSPLVEKVHLLHANPQYAYVVLPDGREDTVSVRDLAPAGAADHYPEHSTVTMHPVPEVTPHAPCPTQTPYASVPGPSLTREGSLTPPVGTELTHSPPSEHTPPPAPVPSSPPAPVQLQPELRRSQRTIRPPDRLNLVLFKTLTQSCMLTMWEWDPLSGFQDWPLFSTPRDPPKSSARLRRAEISWLWRRADRRLVSGKEIGVSCAALIQANGNYSTTLLTYDLKIVERPCGFTSHRVQNPRPLTRSCSNGINIAGPVAVRLMVTARILTERD